MFTTDGYMAEKLRREEVRHLTTSREVQARIEYEEITHSGMPASRPPAHGVGSGGSRLAFCTATSPLRADQHGGG
jgi:hypothetical protein